MPVIVKTTPKTIVLEISKFDAEIIASCMDNMSFGLVKFYGVRRIEKIIKRLRGEYKGGYQSKIANPTLSQ